MFSRPVVAAVLFLFATSSDLYALGLGEIHMQSALNQPLKAQIDMTSAEGTDLSQIKVSLASSDAHRRLGLSRGQALSDLSLSVERDQRGEAIVRLSTRDAIHEPFLEFLLVLEWSNGRLLREYTILVDPPVTMPATPVAPAAPVTRVAPPPVVQEPVRPAATPPPVRVPEAPVRQVVTPPAKVTPDTYGPIKRSETLWQVAERVRPGGDISMDQMMLALLRENPEAFVNNNINNLKAGASLSVPARDDILSVSPREASADTRRQYADWKAARSAARQLVAQQDAPQTVATSESRLQLMAPEADAVAGTAAPGDPDAVRDGASNGKEVQQQLALAAEEAEAGKAQSAELQTRVNELEEQLQTMKRLLELKDSALADLQQSAIATIETTAMDGEIADTETASASVDEAEMQDDVAADSPEVDEPGLAAEREASPEAEPRGIVNKLMDNPVLAALGVFVAMLLGGILWASARQKGQQALFDDEMTLENQIAADKGSGRMSPAPAITVNEVMADDSHDEELEQTSAESDAVTEADVYLAYGRIQQAEDILQAALDKDPGDLEIRLKLLDVFHAGGNVTAFDRAAGELRNDVSEEDRQWVRVAAMGYALSPENELYRAGAPGAAGGVDFDMDLSGLDDLSGEADVAADSGADDLGLDLTAEGDEFDDASVTGENDAEGILQSTDEVATKLDLARAYLDMGDPEGARSILSEVIDEGDVEQKSEAEALISQLA